MGKNNISEGSQGEVSNGENETFKQGSQPRNENNMPEKEAMEGKKGMSMSYIERALYQYINKMIFGGYKKLMEPKYRGFFGYLVFLLISSITVTAMHFFTTYISRNILEIVLVFDLFTALAYVVGGLSGVFFKNGKGVSILTIILCAGAGVGTFFYYLFDLNYDNLIFQSTKLVLLTIYIMISTISIFFIILSFHTSLTYRVLSLGNSPNRLFFSPIIKLASWICLFLFIGLLMQESLITFIISIIGIVITIIITLKMYATPVIGREPSYEEKSLHQAKMNFRQVLGFYNLYLMYRITQSFQTTNGSSTNLWVDLVLMIINVFFVINSLSKKVDRVEDIEKKKESSFSLRRKNRATMKVKKAIGEKGLILIALAIGFSYFVSLVDSYIHAESLISYLGPSGTDLSTNINRGSLLVALAFLAFILVYFKVSDTFKELLINRYSWDHAIRMFGDVMRAKLDHTVEQVKNAVEVSKDKISEWGKGIKDYFKKR